MGMSRVNKTSVYAVDDTTSGTWLGRNRCWTCSLKPLGNCEEIQEGIRGCGLLLVTWKVSYKKPQTSQTRPRTQALPNLSSLFFLLDHLFSQLHMRGFNCLISYNLPIQIFYVTGWDQTASKGKRMVFLLPFLTRSLDALWKRHFPSRPHII